MSEMQTYEGQRINIYFDASKCIHSRNCVLTLPEVFRAESKGPWIFPNAAEPEDIAAVAHTCPSGAIHYQRLDRDKQEAPPQINTIRVWENGPLAVHAELQIANQAPAFRATLCRCGASRNKPFCDGSHSRAQFRSPGELPSGDIKPLAQRNGPLQITPLPDGPLSVTGNVEICTGTGRAILRTQGTTLCRCGASQDKPYCDGSHRGAGFRAP